METTYMENTLVAYYSLFCNTERVALGIAKQTDAALREIIPDKNYSFDYDTITKEVGNQIARGFYPKLIPGNESIDNYQIIFIGTPNWFKTMAPPAISLLQQHDFTRKIVVPFCTHGDGGFGQIENGIAKACPNSKILPGIAANGMITPEEITGWLEVTGHDL